MLIYSERYKSEVWRSPRNSDEKGHGGGIPDAKNIQFLDLGAGYIGVCLWNSLRQELGSTRREGLESKDSGALRVSQEGGSVEHRSVEGAPEFSSGEGLRRGVDCAWPSRPERLERERRAGWRC